MQNEDDSDVVWDGFQENRNSLRTKNGFFVDHNADQCVRGQKCSKYFRDHWANPEFSSEQKLKSSMADFPFGWTLFKRISLEACAVCPESNAVYGCVQWGAEWPLIADKKFLAAKVFAQPSLDFVQALKIFTQFYK